MNPMSPSGLSSFQQKELYPHLHWRFALADQPYLPRGGWGLLPNPTKPYQPLPNPAKPCQALPTRHTNPMHRVHPTAPPELRHSRIGHLAQVSVSLSLL